MITPRLSGEDLQALTELLVERLKDIVIAETHRTAAALHARWVRDHEQADVPRGVEAQRAADEIASWSSARKPKPKKKPAKRKAR